MHKQVIATTNHQFIAKWQRIIGAPVAVLPTYTELMIYLKTHSPDYIVLDMNMSGVRQNSLLRRIVSVKKQALLIFSGIEFTPEMEIDAMGLGAVACCPTQMPEEESRRIIEAVTKKGVWMSSQAITLLLKNMQQMSQSSQLEAQKNKEQFTEKFSLLTRREHQIAKLVASGKNNREIADILGITERTIKAHLTSVFEKLQIHNRTQLTSIFTQVNS